MATDDSREMLARMADVGRLRDAQRADPARAARVMQVRAYQVRRFEHAYADLLADARYGQAARFFLEELYAARAFDERDAQFTRVIPTIGRFFPKEVVQTVERLTELLAITEAMDDELARCLPGADAAPTAPSAPPPGALPPLTAVAYAAAWRAAGHPGQRHAQVELTLRIGADLDRYTRSRTIRMTLKLMRAPARAAGLQALQHFLESGFDAFARMGGAQDFLERVRQREERLLTALFASDRGDPAAWRVLLPADG